MRSFWEKLTQKQKKGYIILIIINLIYGLGFIVCFLADMWLMSPNVMGVGFSLFYFLIIPIYLIFYGVFSYSNTNHILVPNLLVAATTAVFLIIIMLINWYDKFSSRSAYDPGFLIVFYTIGTIILISIIVSAISAAISAITKKVTISQQKRLNQATQSTPPAQPPQEP